MNRMVKYDKSKKPIHISKKWVKNATFSEFKKNPVIEGLDEKEQIALYEKHSGKKVKTKNKGEGV